MRGRTKAKKEMVGKEKGREGGEWGYPHNLTDTPKIPNPEIP